MPEEIQLLYILGPVGILFLFAIKEFFSYLKTRKNGNGNRINTQLLQELNTKSDKMIEILSEIRGRLSK